MRNTFTFSFPLTLSAAGLRGRLTRSTENQLSDRQKHFQRCQHHHDWIHNRWMSAALNKSVCTISKVWSHECVRISARVKFPSRVEFFLVPLKRSSNLTPLLSPAVSSGCWRMWYPSGLSTGGGKGHWELEAVWLGSLHLRKPSQFCWCNFFQVSFLLQRDLWHLLCTDPLGESWLHLDLNTLHLNLLPSYKQTVLGFLIDSWIYL